MDPATLIGVALAFIAVFASMMMEGGNPMSIFLLPPLLLVFFGTIGAAMAGGLLKDTTGLVPVLKTALLAKVTPANDAVTTVVGLAERARREGLLALEDAIGEVEDPFLRKGLELAVDGTDPEQLREILECEIEAKRVADKSGVKLLADMGGYAPTIGIIGTVLGLVHVLENLAEPAELGHLIAGAFVATLWGVLSANVLWLPLSKKVARVSELECRQMELAVEGIMAIQAGASPRIVAQKLRSYLPPGSEAAQDKAA